VNDVGSDHVPLVVLPALAGPLDTLWELVLDLAGQLPPEGWVLVGGQMVMLHGQVAGRVATRASQDVDVLADLLTDAAALARCVHAVRQLNLEPEPDSAGKVYRFVRASDNAKADILAPDHTPPRRRTGPPRRLGAQGRRLGHRLPRP